MHNIKYNCNGFGDYIPTPDPIALKMIEWADLNEGEHVLEPSAGHGAIARQLPNFTHNTAIEVNEILANDHLIKNFKGHTIIGNFEKYVPDKKFDAIIMNPPFGRYGDIAKRHL